MGSNDITSLLEKFLKKSLRKKHGKLVTLLMLVAVLALAWIYLGPHIKSMLAGDETLVTVINELTDEDKSELLKNKAIEIKQSVLGEARQRRELLVLEKDIKIESQWESAWGGLDIFKKTKRIVSYGTGYFDVDLSALDENSIDVNHEKNVVTITVPHAALKSISIDEGKTEYEDTQRGGMLGFGELKLTAEQQGLFKEKVEENMRSQLEKPEVLEEADAAGKVAVAEIYRPVISVVSDEYTVDVNMK